MWDRVIGRGRPHSSRGHDLFPRYNLLDSILAAIERRVAEDFGSLDDLKEWIATASRSALDEELRPPDAVLGWDTILGDLAKHGRGAAAGRKIAVGGINPRSSKLKKNALTSEYAEFLRHIDSLSAADLSAVQPLPYRRTLGDDESNVLWSALGTRWGVDGYWYPIDRAADALPPPDTAAFQAEPFFDSRLVGWLAHFIRRTGAERGFELREGTGSADREIDLELFRPWYNFDEGFWVDGSGDWLLYASHQGSITIAGAQLLSGLKSVWHNWEDYLYTAPVPGVERQVGPGVFSTWMPVQPPPGWSPPPAR